MYRRVSISICLLILCPHCCGTCCWCTGTHKFTNSQNSCQFRSTKPTFSSNSGNRLFFFFLSFSSRCWFEVTSMNSIFRYWLMSWLLRNEFEIMFPHNFFTWSLIWIYLGFLYCTFRCTRGFDSYRINIIMCNPIADVKCVYWTRLPTLWNEYEFGSCLRARSFAIFLYRHIIFFFSKLQNANTYA